MQCCPVGVSGSLKRDIFAPDGSTGRGLEPLPRSRTGGKAAVDDRHTVDEYIRNTARKVLRPVEGGLVADRRRREEGEVRRVAFLDQAALAELEVGGRERSHLPHGLLEADRLLLADVDSEHPRVVAE